MGTNWRVLYLSSSFRRYSPETVDIFRPIHATIETHRKMDIYILPNVKNYFIETALTIKYELEKRGVAVDILTQPSSDRCSTIIFGVNATPSFATRPTDIIVNMEQWSPESEWFTPAYIEQLKTHEVWDYCKFNCRMLEQKLGIKAKLFQYGYVPSLRTIVPSIDKDIDVLHYGASVPRRLAIRDQLLATGVRAHFYDLAWGEERNRLWGRTKIFLNIHAYSAGLLETARLSLVLNNGLFIISETASDIDNYTEWTKCIVFVSYDQLVAAIVRYLSQPEERERFSCEAHLAYQAIRTIVPVQT